MARAPKAGYDFPAKQHYRESIWKVFADRLDPKKACVLFFPGPEGLEIPVALGLGFREENLIAVDESAAVLAMAKWRKTYPKIRVMGSLLSRAMERLREEGIKIDAANLDFCSNISAPLIEQMQAARDVLLVAFTLLKGREDPAVHAMTMFAAPPRMQEVTGWPDRLLAGVLTGLVDREDERTRRLATFPRDFVAWGEYLSVSGQMMQWGIVQQRKEVKLSHRAHDLTGRRFGKLTVVEYTGKKKERIWGPTPIWRCKCDCGNISDIPSSDLLNSGDRPTRSCGKCDREVTKAFVGLRFGRLVTIELSKRKSGQHRLWRCKCDCGNEAFVLRRSLAGGHTTSCGCKTREAAQRHVGKRFGSTVAVERAPGRGLMLCKCDCGESHISQIANLTTGRTTSCNPCYYKRRSEQREDLTGRRFGKLTVLSRDPEQPRRWRCRCDCGNIHFSWGTNLKMKQARSCGCSRNASRSTAEKAEAARKRRTMRCLTRQARRDTTQRTS